MDVEDAVDAASSSSSDSVATDEPEGAEDVLAEARRCATFFSSWNRPSLNFSVERDLRKTNRVVDVVRERTREPRVDCFHQWVFVFGLKVKV